VLPIVVLIGLKMQASLFACVLAVYFVLNVFRFLASVTCYDSVLL
jgi:hypothetical protein